MPPKRPIATAATAAVKRKRTTAVVGPGKKKGVAIPSAAASSTSSSSASSSSASINQQLYDEFVQLLSKPQYKGRGIANSTLKSHFDVRYPELVPIINDLTRSSRLTMSKHDDDNGGAAGGTTSTSEVYFSLLSMEEATKLHGLDTSSKMVYQVIEASGSRGIWTVDIRIQTNIQQVLLTKIFKQLETRRLIKPIKSVTAKTKKLYMLYDLTPAKEITGGPWYSEYEFDFEFIAELRNFILLCISRMNGGYGVGQGVTIQQIMDKMTQANVSRVQLSYADVSQLVQTLILDTIVEQHGITDNGDAVYVTAKSDFGWMCDFGWWDVLSPDFHYRGIMFEDGVYLAPHEPHHHS